jgi:hypothetical protein
MAESKNRDVAIIAEKEILQKVTIAMRSPAGPKRWFWELLQNAVDTISDEPDRKVNIKVILKEREDGNGATMCFEHDGAAFLESDNPNKFDDFKNLILPRSGKRTSDVKKVGKFGTGFLSTHSLSLKIDVAGAYKSVSGDIYEINTKLDRTSFMNEDDKYDSNRIDSIINGLDHYDESLKNKKEASEIITRFVYYLNDEPAIEKVRTGLKDIEQSLPVVLILNSKIGSVHIQNVFDNEEYIYKPGKNHDLGDFSAQDCIKKDGSSEFKYSVAYKAGDSVTLCWPIEAYETGAVRFKDAGSEYRKSVGDKMPLIYSTFPMIGSHGIKFPMIVHSALFKPNEKRDGVSLTDETYTDDTSDEEIELDIINKELLEEAVKLYGSFVTAVAAAGAENPYYILKINGSPVSDWISKSWFKKQISTILTGIVSKIAVVDVSENKADRRSILNEAGEIQVFFPSVTLGADGKDRERLNDTFYLFARDVFDKQIPIKPDLEHWHKILWDDDKVIKILEIEDLLAEISEKYNSIKLLSAKLNFDNTQTISWLNKLYELIDEADSNSLYEDYAVIPNQKGQFKLANYLKVEDPESPIDPNIICVLRKLNADEDWFDLLICRGIKKCKYQFDEVSLKVDASNRINELLIQEKNYNIFLNLKSSLNILQRLLCFTSESETTSNSKKQIFKYSQDVFGEMAERPVPFYKDFKTENVVRHMIRLINNKIAESKDITGLMASLGKTKDATVIWLNGYLNFQCKKEFEDLLCWADVIPNQYEIFCAHGSEDDKFRMFRPYDITESKAVNFLSDQLIKNLFCFDSNEDWRTFLILDGVQLRTLPVKTWFQLGNALDKSIMEISHRILSDNDEQKQVYRKDLIELLEWWDRNKYRAADYFKFLPLNADKLYSLISFSKDFVDILKNKEKFALAKKINNSKLSADTIEKTIDKIEEMQDKLGEGVVEEFLRKAESFIEKKEVFNERLQIGQSIEELLRNALKTEDIDVIPDQSNAGSYDIGVCHKNKPLKILKLEVKSYKHGSSADFSFSPSQIVDSHGDALNYIVCTLQRPANGSASIDYLKLNLQIQNDLIGLTTGFYDKIETFHSIYKDSKSGKIPLEIPCVTDPRVKIDHSKLLQNTGDYNALIDTIKARLL